MGAGFGAAAVKVISTAAAYFVSQEFIVTLVINVLIGQLQKSLNRGAKQFVPPVNVTIRNAIENRRLAFGSPRVGGVYGFVGTSSGPPGSAPTGKYLHYLVVFGGHQFAAIRDLWLDRVRIVESQIDAGTGEVNAGFYAGKVYIWKHLGTGAQTVDAELDAVFPQWSTNHRLRGCPNVHVRMERDEEKFPQGAPLDVTALVDGALLYNARLDSTNGGSGSHRRDDPSTWTFSRNPIDAARWFITGGSVVNDQASRLVRYGLQEPDSRIDDAYTRPNAAICEEQITGADAPPSGDQQRYTIDLEVSTGETRREILDAIMACCAGRAVYQKDKWRLFAGAYDAPAHTITQDDLYTIDEAPIEVEDTSGHEDRANHVAAVFRDANNSFIEQTTPFVTESAYVTQDNGEAIYKEIDLRGVTDPYRAQRLCRIELRSGRNMRISKLRGALNLLKVALHETISLSHTRLTWVARVFRCIERQFEYLEEAGRVALTCKTEQASTYTPQLTGEYLDPNSVTPTQSVEAPEPPTALVTVPQVDAVLIRYTRSSTPGVIYEIQHSTSSSMSSPTTIETPDTQYYLDRTATTTFYFRARAKKAGQVSTWEPASGGVSGAAIGVTVTLSGSASGNATSSGTGASQTTNTVTVTANGGTPPYTYLWTFTVGGTGITIDTNTAAATSFSATGLADPETRTGTARCRITDNVAATFDVEVSVSIERTRSFFATAAGTPPLSKTANASNITSGNITATPNGGTGPFTYLWSIVSHDDPNSTPTINTSTSATCTVTTGQSPATQVTVTVTVRCQVTDTGTGNVVFTNNVTISHSHDNGA